MTQGEEPRYEDPLVAAAKRPRDRFRRSAEALAGRIRRSLPEPLRASPAVEILLRSFARSEELAQRLEAIVREYGIVSRGTLRPEAKLLTGEIARNLLVAERLLARLGMLSGSPEEALSLAQLIERSIAAHPMPRPSATPLSMDVEPLAPAPSTSGTRRVSIVTAGKRGRPRGPSGVARVRD